VGRVDPLKDRKAEIEAIEVGLKSRSDVIESEGYDAEEVDRRIAADHAHEEELGLKFGRPATAPAEPAVGVDPEDRRRPNRSEEQAA
jgi:capsid protein